MRGLASSGVEVKDATRPLVIDIDELGKMTWVGLHAYDMVSMPSSWYSSVYFVSCRCVLPTHPKRIATGRCSNVLPAFPSVHTHPGGSFGGGSELKRRRFDTENLRPAAMYRRCIAWILDKQAA